MRAIEAETFSGYGGLRQIELSKPEPAKDRVLVRVTAAGVTPLDRTILSGGHPRAKVPLVLGNEGAGAIEDAGDSGLAVRSRVMFTLPYGVRENGAWQEWLLVRPEDLALVPDEIDDVVAASLPVAYLTVALSRTVTSQSAKLLTPVDRAGICPLIRGYPRPYKCIYSLSRNTRIEMKTLVAAAALAIAGVVTAQAADIAPVTGHWTKLGEHFSALVYYINEPDGFHGW